TIFDAASFGEMGQFNRGCQVIRNRFFAINMITGFDSGLYRIAAVGRDLRIKVNFSVPIGEGAGEIGGPPGDFQLARKFLETSLVAPDKDGLRIKPGTIFELKPAIFLESEN